MELLLASTDTEDFSLQGVAGYSPTSFMEARSFRIQDLPCRNTQRRWRLRNSLHSVLVAAASAGPGGVFAMMIDLKHCCYFSGF